MLAGALAPVVFAQASAPRISSVEQFLVTQFGAKPAQLEALRRGEPFAVPLAGTVDREVVVGGAIRIEAPPERTVELVRDIEKLESGKGFLNTRKLSSPPRLSDFAAFQVNKEDVAALRKCRPGKCDIKLGKGAFDTVAKINWNGPDVHGEVNHLARQMALDYVEAYRKGGNQELAVYVDSDRPQFIAQEFADMVKRASLLPGRIPELAEFLVNYPVAARAKGVEDFYYWSEAAFGLKPVFRLNHVVIHPGNAATGTRYAIATKQLYANHYFQTALEVRAVVDDESQPGKAHYLLVLNMARSDGLTGAFGGLVKSKARSGSREGLERALLGMKRMAEAR